MKPWMIAACAGLASSILFSQPTIAGDTKPPPGPITGTMTSLDQIEPRVSVSSLPGDDTASHVVSSPGLYIFSSDVTGENGKDGLRIDCDAFPPGEHTVVIAMRGFSMRGVQGAANAILVQNSDPATRRVHVTITGSVRDSVGSPTSLITGWSVDGVHVEGATSVSCECVRVTDCVGDGFEFASPPSSGASVSCFRSSFSSSGGNGVCVTLPAGGASSLEIREVQCLRNAGHGASISYVGAAPSTGKTRVRVASLSVSENSLDGLRIRLNGDESISADFTDLRCSNNVGSGHRVEASRDQSADMSLRYSSCSSSGNGADGFSCAVVTTGPRSHHSISMDRCVSSGNGADGFSCVSSSGAADSSCSVSWTSCSSSENGSSGFYCSSISSLPMRGSLYQCRGSRNTGHGNEMHSADESMDLCVFDDNGGSGVYARNASVRCRDGSCRRNSVSGIDVADALHTRRASMDAMRCDDNGADGMVCNGLSSVSVSSCAFSSNGRGPGGGGGVLCGETTHFLCVSSSSDNNTNDGMNVFAASSATFRDTSCVGNGTGPVGGSGIVCDNVIQCACTHMLCLDNTGDGAGFTECSSLRADSCDLSSNSLHGMRVSGGGGGAGGLIRVRSSSMCSNAGNGLHLADFNGDGMLDVLTCSLNTGSGVYVSDFGLSRLLSVSRCVCSSNTGDGIAMDSAQGLGCGKASLASCVCSSNNANGIALSCTTGGTVSRCESSNNAGVGILVAGNNHVVVENTASSNSGGSLICPTPGNSVGPLTDEAGVSSSSSAANYVR